MARIPKLLLGVFAMTYMLMASDSKIWKEKTATYSYNLSLYRPSSITIKTFTNTNNIIRNARLTYIRTYSSIGMYQHYNKSVSVNALLPQSVGYSSKFLGKNDEGEDSYTYYLNIVGNSFEYPSNGLYLYLYVTATWEELE